MSYYPSTFPPYEITSSRSENARLSIRHNNPCMLYMVILGPFWGIVRYKARISYVYQAECYECCCQSKHIHYYSKISIAWVEQFPYHFVNVVAELFMYNNFLCQLQEQNEISRAFLLGPTDRYVEM
ncbi:hypothetical protein VNO77_14133 [Canavalia gladiata]|uniref:Uncharacterized protein n=1 Tax=Canavalia gladiata TaxID=3824 RepID=A0AAN9M345_CANGL